jgi:GNAT superfamily N-acetyltransferase
MESVEALDGRWAQLLQCDPQLLHSPGLHVIRGTDLDRVRAMNYVIPFFALFPAHTPHCALVIADDIVCREIEAWPIQTGVPMAEQLEDRFLTVAQQLKTEDSYIFDVLAAPLDELRLETSHEVKQLQRESAEAIDWNGVRLSDEVDGRLFGIFDKQGLAAWAGEKLVSDVARDMQVGTRPDARRRGLAKKVTSHVIQAIIDSGITPYYSHLRGNYASAQLAASLGFKPYGSAVLAEYKVRSAE